MTDSDKLKRRARKARTAAESDASTQLLNWYKIEAQKIKDDPELGDIALAVKKRELLMEFGRRSKKALGRARRQNSVSKVLEREVRAEIETDRAKEQDGWSS